AMADLHSSIEALRLGDLVDYGGVAHWKTKALRLAFEALCNHGSEDRRRQFDDFKRARGSLLQAFVAFEQLRRRFGTPWWEWPAEFCKPNEAAPHDLGKTNAEALDYHAFVQWIAHEQLMACRAKAHSAGPPIGLYLDVAVGVRADGFDAWSNQDFILPSLEIGAPPDQLNTEGQRWGLAGVNPLRLIESGCAPFAEVLR